ncbi:MAG: hypothetical protein K2Z81_15750, partial [Cyanobacteria bacterium]|nr:hypothetical protein [Cyanobacteriota bacterium]
ESNVTKLANSEEPTEEFDTTTDKGESLYEFVKRIYKDPRQRLLAVIIAIAYFGASMMAQALSYRDQAVFEFGVKILLACLLLIPDRYYSRTFLTNTKTTSGKGTLAALGYFTAATLLWVVLRNLPFDTGDWREHDAVLPKCIFVLLLIRLFIAKGRNNYLKIFLILPLIVFAINFVILILWVQIAKFWMMFSF